VSKKGANSRPRDERKLNMVLNETFGTKSHLCQERSECQENIQPGVFKSGGG